MGKQSRRKGNKKDKSAGKKAHKKRQQERRELAELRRSAYDDEHDGRRPFLVGDRVFFKDMQRSDEDNPNTYRGIVKRVREDSDAPSLDILPLHAEEDRVDLTWNIPADEAFTDWWNWTLRFDVGDKVLCRTPQGWLPATVMYQWPIYELEKLPKSVDDAMVFYKCTLNLPAGVTFGGPTNQVKASSDEDDCIMKQPTAFRFSEGDEVFFAADKAKGIAKRYPTQTWIAGAIKRVNIIARHDYYAVYECSFTQKGKLYSCHILKDDDEHVAKSNANPRDRLMEAIEQDCSFGHIDYLITSFGVDVSTFLDLVLAKSIEFASYDALLWLQENLSVDLDAIRDEKGNNLLHQIAASPRATRFLLKASRISFLPQNPYIDLESGKDPDDVWGMICKKNDDNDTWLHILCLEGNVRALDCALSPNAGMAWMTLFSSEKDIESLLDAAQRSRQVGIEHMINEAVSFHTLKNQQHSLRYGLNGDKKEDEFLSDETMAEFVGDNAKLAVKRFVRFCDDWMFRHPSFRSSIDGHFRNIAACGYFRLFRLLVEEDESLLDYSLEDWVTRENLDEYTQPELYEFIDASDASIDDYSDKVEGYSLVAVTVIGRKADHPTKSEIEECGGRYLDALRYHMDVCADRHSWLSHIQKELERLSDSCGPLYGYKRMLAYKISLLEDDGSLSDRLKILDYLVKDKCLSAPSPLDVIRFRQCGVLQWMVGRSILDLDTDACTVTSLVQFAKASKLEFLSSRPIPASVSVGAFLCFAAIEFDDLQSLQWLVEEMGIPIEPLAIVGWNVVHASAYFGRSEVIMWLHTQTAWTSLIGQICTRDPRKKRYAVHIAVERGLVFAADLLLSFGCPSSDSAGKSADFYARKSSHTFVRQWGEKKAKPLRLENDIQKLFRILSSKTFCSEDAKKHILSTKCLEIETWTDCEYRRFDTPGTRGESYASTLLECCKCHDCGFVLWLCNRLSWSDDIFERLNEGCMFNDFWGRELFLSQNRSRDQDAEQLTKFAHDIGDEELAGWLARSWARKMTRPDPQKYKPIVGLIANDLSIGGISAKLREKLLRVDVLSALICIGESEVRSQLRHDPEPEEIQDIVEVVCSAATRLAREEEREMKSYFISSYTVTSDGFVNIETSIFNEYSETHPVYRQMLYRGVSHHELSKLYRVLAIENYFGMIKWCFSRACPWDVSKELEMVRISAFFGHSETLDLFLNKSANYELLSSTTDRFEAAMFGAAEAGRATELKGYLKICKTSADPITTRVGKIPTDYEYREERTSLYQHSLSAAAVSGCLRGIAAPESSPSGISIDIQHLEVLKCLVEMQVYKAKTLLYTAGLLLMDTYDVSSWERLPSLFSFLHEEYGLKVWQCGEEISLFNRALISLAGVIDPKDDERLSLVIAKWLGGMKDFGLDLQSWHSSSYHKAKECSKRLASLKEDQVRIWAQFDILKHGRPLVEIQEAVKSGNLCLHERDRGGLLLAHLAASYNRADLLEWLVDAKGMDLNAADGLGRNVLQVAEASKASSTTRWIAERQARKVIASFLATHFCRKLDLQRKQRMLAKITKVQAIQRGKIVRKSYRSIVVLHLEESQRFQAIWERSIGLASKLSSCADGNWASIREQQHDIRRADLMDSETVSETGRTLGEAMSSAMNEMDSLQLEDHEMDGGQDYEESEPTPTIVETEPQEQEELHSILASRKGILFTKDVVKWLERSGDTKYREFFVRRMDQLAVGDRSRILAKRLKGSKSVIYETYLEQKSGFRILWKMDPNGNLVVWFVAKHKDVSRLMRLIDDSESRSLRQRMPASLLPEFQQEESSGATSTADERHILLDPLGNVPLKLYGIHPDEIQEIINASWKPRLHLTDEERDVVEAKGTVLLLGRSGTGKTICICNRMDYDRQRMAHMPAFSQLFVARSQRLCKYVCNAVGADPRTTFTTFVQLVQSLENLLPKLESTNDVFLPSQQVDFARFKREVYQGNAPGDVDALIVWANVHSFIKGSIEAVQEPGRILSMEDYVKLGKKRCRLSQEQRESVYKVFLRYCKYLADLNLWDDCDRIAALLQRLEEAKCSDPVIYEQARRSKIYVDEIQDYTQAEILLFFYLSGPGDLFLAGDSAQSVVEGVEFRFEEIRSVGYHIAGPERRELIPQKPKTVNLNFRSHSGILNTAAAILKCLFGAFPDSAKQMKEDRGLFRGPRPGVFHRVQNKRLSALISEKLNGVVILTHDASASRWKRALGGYPLVYGIRAAKGLEFKRVILLDFFAELPKVLQKPWRDLLLGRGELDFNILYPEVEGHLKLLYTAVTRCIEQLFFAESSASEAGNAFVRWLTTTSVRQAPGLTQGKQNAEALATRNSVDDVGKMTMTRDEWLVAGIDNAEAAEGVADTDVAQSEAMLEKAIYCFEQAEDTTLASKARTHRSSVRFRSALPLVDDASSLQIEVKAAELMEKLMLESLLTEGRAICKQILPYLSPYAREHLHQRLLSQLDS